MNKGYMDSKHQDDIVIVSAVRTPICKAGRGNLKELTNDVLVHHVIKGLLEKVKIDPCKIDEICFGHGLSPMNGTNALRIGALRSGIPVSTPMSTINRQCGSGLDSIDIISSKLQLNKIQVGLAGGFESMSCYKIEHGKLTPLDDDKKKVKDCFMPMGETAEILAKKHGISRESADEYAFRSQKKAVEHAEERKCEMVPVMVNDVLINQDDGVRETELQRLRSLKSCFQENGVCTAGNSSQLSDGASAVLMMKRGLATSLGLDVKSVVCGYAVVGLEPSVMGEGPVPAIRKLLKDNCLHINDIQYFEINEAFACQALYCINELGIDERKVNKYGGSIALGHPIGCTGGRLVASCINVMEQENMKGYAVAAMCVGTGQGVALLIKKE